VQAWWWRGCSVRWHDTPVVNAAALGTSLILLVWIDGRVTLLGIGVGLADEPEGLEMALKQR